LTGQLAPPSSPPNKESSRKSHGCSLHYSPQRGFNTYSIQIYYQKPLDVSPSHLTSTLISLSPGLTTFDQDLLVQRTKITDLGEDYHELAPKLIKSLRPSPGGSPSN
jgi:hypothetical protein